MEGAWNISKGLFPVRVAVIDDGVEAHPDLGNRVLQGYTPPGHSNIYGAPASDQHGHGQSCSGIIAATSNNNLGIAGISPCAEIVPVNILGYSGLSTTDQANAIDWAWDQGQAAVLSNSWGLQKNVDFPDISAAIQRARTLGRSNKGSVVVFSSGNDNVNSSGVFFPGSAEGVLTIGALDGNGVIWNYSDRGPEMDLVAPSGNKSLLGDIRTIDRVGSKGFETGDYTNRFGGTSASCPEVAAIAALMISVNPNLTEQQVVNLLRGTAQDLGAPGFDNTHGFGLVNAQAALLAVQPDIVGQDFVCTSQSQFSVAVPAGSSVTWTVSSNISIVSGQGSSTVVLKAISSGLRGPGTINASVTNNCGSVTNFKQKSVWVGKPNTPPDEITGEVNPNIGHAKRYFSLTAAPGATSHEWILPYNSRGCAYCWSFYTISTPFDMWALVGEDAGYMQFRGTNTCGAGGAQLLYITPTGQGGCNPCQLVSPFPNPTSGNLAIQYNIENLGKLANIDLKNETKLPFEVEFRLRKENGDVIYTRKSTEINPVLDLFNISEGLYYLDISYSGKGSDVVRIVLEK